MDKKLNPIIMVGLPGSGKTTVFEKLESALKSEGISILSRNNFDEFLMDINSTGTRSKLLLILKSGLYSWVFFIISFSKIILSGHHWRVSLKKTISFSIMRSYLLAKNKEKNEVIIMDQFFETPLALLASEASKPEKLTSHKGLIKSFYRGIPCTIIFFDIDINIAIKRLLLKSEARWWTKGITKTEIIDKIKRREKQYLALEHCIKEFKHIEKINGDLYISKKVAYIYNLLDKKNHTTF